MKDLRYVNTNDNEVSAKSAKVLRSVNTNYEDVCVRSVEVNMVEDEINEKKSRIINNRHNEINVEKLRT